MVRTWKESKAARDSLTNNVRMGLVRTQGGEGKIMRGQRSASVRKWKENEQQVTLTVVIKRQYYATSKRPDNIVEKFEQLHQRR